MSRLDYNPTQRRAQRRLCGAVHPWRPDPAAPATPAAGAGNDARLACDKTPNHSGQHRAKTASGAVQWGSGRRGG